MDEEQIVGFASAVHYVHPDKPPELWINEMGVVRQVLEDPQRGVYIRGSLVFDVQRANQWIKQAPGRNRDTPAWGMRP